ncbi:hypothetical protein ACFE04_010891 [Oxalis oulophora]
MNSTKKHRGAALLVSPSQKRLTTSFILTVTALLALCKKHTTCAAKTIKKKVSTTAVAVANSRNKPMITAGGAKKLLASVSDKAMKIVQRNKRKEEVHEGFGDGGVWQKEILRGERCQPMEFSGVIYYDCNGKQINEMPPKSPRATATTSPFPSYLNDN